MLIAALVLAGCSTFDAATAPDEAASAPAAANPTAQADAPARDTAEASLDPRVANLYDLEARLVAAEWVWQKRALLNQAMAELVTLLDNSPDLVNDPEFRAVHRGLMAEYRRFHGYAQRDTMETARGDIFAFRASLFDALNRVDEPLLEDVMDPVQGDRPGTEVPMTTNRLVQRSIEYLQEQPDKHVNTWMKRAQTYFPMIEHILEEEGVPDELKYLAMIESGLNPQARSWASAVGMWQFMAGTARSYDLTIDGWVDERRDPEKSTRAAARHLRDLHDQFGDWHLALAGYNCGAYCVKRAIRRSGQEDPSYWDVYDYLPRETRGYVPMYIAAAIVTSNPEEYGLDPAPSAPAYAYDYVPVQSGMLSLREVARLAGTDRSIIRALNPEIRRSTLPPTKEEYYLRVPLGQYERFIRTYAQLPDDKKRPVTAYRVRRGDTLSEIAERFGTSTRRLQRTNGLRNSLIRVGQQLIVPVGDYESALASVDAEARPMRVQYEASYPIQPLQEVQLASAETTSSSDEESGPPVRQARLETTADAATPASGAEPEPAVEEEEVVEDESASEMPVTYTVRRGDTLSEIADRYGVRTAELRRWNGLASSRINVGQTLRLMPGEPQEASTSYTVRRGDTLSEIAEQFGTSIRAIRQQNSLSGSRIRVGQRLRIPMGATSGQVVHRVRRGDTIGAIAQRYGVSISDIKRWNGLRGTTIFPGQQLVIMQ